MAKATHNGTCQICGRLQALTARGIAKHGYTVDSGYFSGTCAGSGYPALQISRDLLDQRAKRWLLDSHAMSREAEEIEIGTRKVTQLRLPVRSTGWYTEYKVLTYTEAQAIDQMTARHWLAAAQSYPRQLRAEARALRQHVMDMMALADRTHGQPLVARAG